MTTGALPVVAIDGPSGSGKGTIGRLLAERLGWHYLDSGALYRLVALAALKHHLDLANAPSLGALAAGLDAQFAGDRVLLEGAEVGAELRAERTGDAASRVAIIPEVRAALLERQRAFAAPPGLVADGRDMGTVVFPTAPVKIVLTASTEARAMRRHKQLKEKGIDVSLPDLSWDIAQRDARDAARTVAPYKPAPDAHEIDSTSLTPEDVVARILLRLEDAGIRVS